MKKRTVTWIMASLMVLAGMPAQIVLAEESELTDFTIGYAGLDESQEHLVPVGENIEKVAAEKSEELGIDIKVVKVDNAGDGAKALRM